MEDSTEKLLDAIDRLARELPPPTIRAVAAKLASIERPLVRGDLVQFGATQQSKTRLAALEELLAGTATASCAAAALALRSSLHTTEELATSKVVEVAWTGPGTTVVPVRRVDQVMYELVNGATKDIILASFVAWGAAGALSALHSATQRGVEVTLVLESAQETDGRVVFDGLSQIRTKVPDAAVYVWPLEKRETSRGGKKGLLHVKCLICDAAHALVSSSNLTDHGLELNMELGLVVHGGDVPTRLAEHFRQLIRQGELRRWDG